MRRAILWTCILTSLGVMPLGAGTFDRAAIAPEAGLEALTRGTAREHLGRDLFAHPYATVSLGRVDVYDVFPYVETRVFEVVSDARWNRLVFGAAGRGLGAWDGRGTAVGALRAPRGLAVDDRDRLYIADAGNDRIVVLQAAFAENGLTLTPLYTIAGVGDPQALAFSDGGTAFDAADDRLYVAEAGRNQISVFALGDRAARAAARIGTLGSGSGRFAGPLAVAVGRDGGRSTGDVYVADAHTRRLVRLRDHGDRLEWIGETRHDLEVVTALDTDHWGNVYLAAPRDGRVRKYSPTLEVLAELREPASRPRGFHVPFVTVRDHRHGTEVRAGRPNAVTLDDWNDERGLRLWTLGLDVAGFEVLGAGAPAMRFTLTDPAVLSYEIQDAGGRVVARRNLGVVAAGQHTLPLVEDDLGAAGAGDLVLRLSAASRYEGGPTAGAAASFRFSGGGLLPAATTRLLGSSPNPALAFARIAFVLAGGDAAARLTLFDASGRRVRVYAGPFGAGRNEIVWDGRDERGAPAGAGVYFYRLEAGGREYGDRLVLSR